MQLVSRLLIWPKSKLVNIHQFTGEELDFYWFIIVYFLSALRFDSQLLVLVVSTFSRRPSASFPVSPHYWLLFAGRCDPEAAVAVTRPDASSRKLAKCSLAHTHTHVHTCS